MQRKLFRKPREHTAADGHRGAVDTSCRISDSIVEVVTEYRQLNAPGARGVFADFWLRKMASNLELIWGPYYELMKLVKDEGLYAKPEYMDGKSFERFGDFWNDVTRKPLARWAELESTYRYVHEHCPELKEKLSLNDAVKYVKDKAANPLPINPDGVKASDRCSVDNINGQPIRDTGAGTSANYLTARITRDRPDILDRMKAGEFKSVRAAALEAGIVQPSFQCPDDPVKAVQRILGRFQGERFEAFKREWERRTEHHDHDAAED